MQHVVQLRRGMGLKMKRRLSEEDIWSLYCRPGGKGMLVLAGIWRGFLGWNCSPITRLRSHIAS